MSRLPVSAACLTVALWACQGNLDEDTGSPSANGGKPGAGSVPGSGTMLPGDQPGPVGMAQAPVPAPEKPSETPTPPVQKPVPSCAMPDVATAPLRRLTRDQYASAIRDLFALPARPAVDGLAQDESIGTFRSNTVGAATDLMTQQFMEQSEKLTRTSAAKLETLVPCDRAALGDDACAVAFIDKFGLRAYRRPLDAAEKGRYKTLFSAYGKSGGYAEGLRIVVQTMLQSAHFLYHIDFAEPGLGVVPVGPFALASRLSFFLWGSIPDPLLLDAAATGKLAAVVGVSAEVARMVKDVKARDGLLGFHLQWLDIEGISSVGKDKTAYPTYTNALRDAMRAETSNFIDHVLRKGDGRLETLLTSSSSMVDGPLFELYGATRPAGFTAGSLVPLDPTQRAGLLTHATVMTVHAHANQSSPVSRGVAIRKNILCQPLPDPPPNVNSTAPDPKPGLTTRERFSEHKKNPSCAGCHKLIDDVGFGFERYDGIGAYRAMEGDKPVDARGDVIGTNDVNGPFDGAVELAKRLGKSQDVQACVTKQWFRYSLGRNESDADKCTLDQLQVQFANSGGDIRSLIAALATSNAFRFRRAVAPTP